MSFDERVKLIAQHLRLFVICSRLVRGYANDSAKATDAPKWITVHPHGKGPTASGENAKGSPVLLEEETGEVLGGMGGKYNGVHISEACSKEPTENAQHLIKRGQEQRANPTGFAQKQKEVEERAKKTLQEQQEAAKKEAEELKAKQEAAKQEAEKAKQEAEAKAKQEAEKAKQEAETKSATETEQQTKSPMQHLSATSSAEEINKAFDSIKQITSDGPFTQQQIESSVKIKSEAIQNLYKTNDKEAAKAFATRVKKVGPPANEYKNIGEVRDYLSKLLPHAHFCMENTDLRSCTAVAHALHTVLKEFPGVGKYFTVVGDAKSADIYAGINSEGAFAASKYKHVDRIKKELNRAIAKREIEQKYNDTLSTYFDGKTPLTGERLNEFLSNFRDVKETLVYEERHPSFYDRNLAERLVDAAKRTQRTDSPYLTAYTLKKLKTPFKRSLIYTEAEKATNKEWREKYGKLPNWQEKDKSGLLETGSLQSDALAHCQYQISGYYGAGTFNGYNSAIQVKNKHFDNFDQLNTDKKMAEASTWSVKTEVDGATAVMIHELGHALEAALWKEPIESKRPSNRRDFVMLFNQAVRHPDNNRKGYWATDSCEYFAECVAAGLGGAADKNHERFKKGFDCIKQMYQTVFL